MSVESNVSFVANLNELYPRKNDLIKEGDDHLRLIKRVLKSTFPGFKNAVSMTSDKLNLIDQGLEVDSAAITFKKPLKLGDGSSLDVGGKKLTGLAEPLADTDAVTLKYLKKLFQDTTWPVNSLYFSSDGINPATKFGFGTWVAFGAGRVLIGAGTTTDTRGEAKTFALGSAGGEFNHVMTGPELPGHTHTAGGLTAASAGNHTHGGYVGKGGASFEHHQFNSRMPSEQWQNGTDAAGDHTHTITGETGVSGSSAAHNNTQPYITVSIWKRTA